MHWDHGELGREHRGGCAVRGHDAGGLNLDLAISDLVDEACGDGAGNGNDHGDRDGSRWAAAGRRRSCCRATWNRRSGCKSLASLNWNSGGRGHSSDRRYNDGCVTSGWRNDDN